MRLYGGRSMNLANTSGVDTTFRRSMLADLRLLTQLRRDLRAWLDAHAITADDGDSLVLACSEAVANAVEHAYQGNREGLVMIEARLTEAYVEMSVHDDGEWIPPRQLDGSGQIRGRGLVVIQRVMDAVAIDTRDGTTVRLRRDLNRRHRRDRG